MQAIKCMSQPHRRREIRIISVISCFLLNWIINPKQGTQWEQGKVMNKITHHGVIPFWFHTVKPIVSRHETVSFTYWNREFHGMKLTIPNGETRASNRQSVRIKNSDAKVIRCKRRIVNKIRCKRRTTIETIFSERNEISRFIASSQFPSRDSRYRELVSPDRLNNATCL